MTQFWNKRFHFVYKTTNKINGLFYIGVHSTDDLNDGYLGSSNLISAAIKKYGTCNFIREILKYFNDRNAAYNYEKSIVTEELIKSRITYDRVIGGNGGFLGSEALERMRVSRKGQPACNKGTGRVHNCQLCGQVTKSDTAKFCRSCYKCSKIYVGARNPAFTGWYITPIGKFGSLRSASFSTNIPKTTLRRYCKNSKPGFGFEPKN